MAEANPDHIGKFAYCEYWGKWDKILACGKRDSGVFWWQVQEVGERLVRCHSTPIPVDCIFDAPRIEGDHHLPPLRDIADSSKGAEVMAPRCSSAPALQPSSPCAGPDQATPWA